MVLGTPTNFRANLYSDNDYSNESIVVVLDGNFMKILDLDNQIKNMVNIAPYKLTTCSKVGVTHVEEDIYSILVFCSSSTAQELLRY